VTREAIQSEIMAFSRGLDDGQTVGIEPLVERMRDVLRIPLLGGEIRASIVRLIRLGDLELTDDFLLRIPAEEVKP